MGEWLRTSNLDCFQMIGGFYLSGIVQQMAHGQPGVIRVKETMLILFTGEHLEAHKSDNYDVLLLQELPLLRVTTISAALRGYLTPRLTNKENGTIMPQTLRSR